MTTAASPGLAGTGRAGARTAGLELAGTPVLTRLGLRRSRIMIAGWIYAVAAFAYVSVIGTRKLAPTVASRIPFEIAASTNRVTLALYGPASDLRTLGGLSTWKLNVYGAAAAALMSIFLVIRQTRGDEDAGRLELVDAGAVGRQAALAAGLLTALIASLALALLGGATLAVSGLPVIPSLAYGLGMAAVGIAFAAITAVAAQLAASARTATGLVISLLGVAYVLRAIGDTATPGTWPSWLTWLSPIGWTQALRPFGPLHWWALSISVMFTIAVSALAFVLAGRRDLGTGLLPVRPGPMTAGPRLAGPFGLAWRLQRGPLLAWSAGIALYGLIMGALANGVASLVGNSASMRDLFVRLGGHTGLVNAFLAATMGFMAVFASVYAVQAVLRMRAEESGQRAEPVLAGAVGRTKWALSHLAFAIIGPAVLLVIAGLTSGLIYGAASGDVGAGAGRMLGSALVQLPAVWVLAGIAALLFGLVPRITAAAWGALVLFLGLTELGSFTALSRWLPGISPFTHVPKLPGGTFSAIPLLWLVSISAVLTVAGLAAFRHRDLT
jgi:polyether ionophore transport system permease protein